VAQASKELGVKAVLAKRMVEERLPKALALKERIDRGELLNGLDLNFLEQVVKDANEAIPMVKDDPRVMEVAARMLQLYKEITSKALENEQAKKIESRIILRRRCDGRQKERQSGKKERRGPEGEIEGQALRRGNGEVARRARQAAGVGKVQGPEGHDRV
jgi:hypothetical protein